MRLVSARPYVFAIVRFVFTVNAKICVEVATCVVGGLSNSGGLDGVFVVFWKMGMWRVVWFLWGHGVGREC